MQQDDNGEPYDDCGEPTEETCKVCGRPLCEECSYGDDDACWRCNEEDDDNDDDMEE